MTAWELGALIHWACPERKVGRPKKGSTDNLTELARSLKTARSRLSELAACYEFWGEDYEDLPPQISWHHANYARKQVGWKPGQEVTVEQKRLATERLVSASEDGVKIVPREWHEWVTDAKRCIRRALENAPKSARDALIVAGEALEDV